MRERSRCLGLVWAGMAACAGEGWAQATEGATPVAPKTWRVDADVYALAEDWSMPEGWGDRSTAEAWGCVQVATGVTERWEARVTWLARGRSKLDGAVTEGAGDLYLAAKGLLAGDEAEGAAWSVMPYVKLPTGDGRFTDDTVDCGALLIFGCPWGEAGYVNAQLGWDDYGDGGGGRDGGASAAAVAGRAFGERWTVYGEGLGGKYPANGDGDAFAASLGGGATWAGDADGSWGLDLAAYGGVTRSAPDLLAVLRVWWEWSGPDR